MQFWVIYPTELSSKIEKMALISSSLMVWWDRARSFYSFLMRLSTPFLNSSYGILSRAMVLKTVMIFKVSSSSPIGTPYSSSFIFFSISVTLIERIIVSFYWYSWPSGLSSMLIGFFVSLAYFSTFSSASESKAVLIIPYLPRLRWWLLWWLLSSLPRSTGWF